MNIPEHTCSILRSREHEYLVIIPVINEGTRIQTQLELMYSLNLPADIVIVDGGSTDDSLNLSFLEKCRVTALLTKTGPGKQSAQLRIGLKYMLDQGYAGCILMDGNGKDGPEAIPDFVGKLQQGFDFIQGSRYAPGGQGINTPLERHLAVRLVHAPLISLASRYWYTDTTNGFRGLSRKFVEDPRLQPFRAVFSTYNLHYYLARQAPRLGFRVCEIGVTRAYPKNEVPSKINGIKGKLHILKLVFLTLIGAYDPKE